MLLNVKRYNFSCLHMISITLITNYRTSGWYFFRAAERCTNPNTYLINMVSLKRMVIVNFCNSYIVCVWTIYYIPNCLKNIKTKVLYCQMSLLKDNEVYGISIVLDALMSCLGGWVAAYIAPALVDFCLNLINKIDV